MADANEVEKVVVKDAQDQILGAPNPGETANGVVTNKTNPNEKPAGWDEQHNPETAEQKAAKEKLAAEAKAKEEADKAKTDEDKAAEEAAKKAEEDKEKWDGKEYITLEDPNGQAAIDLLKEKGVSPTEANAIFQAAIESGKLEDVKWDELEAKVGKSHAQLIRTGVENFYNNKYKVQQAEVIELKKIVGGDANWTKISTWAKAAEKVDAGIATKVAGIRKALDIGGYAAEIGVKELKALYEADPKNGGLGQNKVLEGERVDTSQGTPLGREEYLELTKKAHARSRGPEPGELASLNARRVAGQKLGK